MLCPKCGAQLSDSAVICRVCGTMLPEHSLPQQQPYQPAQYPAGNAAQNTCSTPRTCAQCGAPLEDGMRFCTNCGAPVPERPDPAQSVPPRQDTAASCIPGICPHCGSRLNPSARFCTVCGTLAPEMPAAAPEWYGAAPGGAVSSPEIGPKHKPKKLLIGLLCGFAALVVIVAVLIGLFAASGGIGTGTTNDKEVDRLVERYFAYFSDDDINGMSKIYLPQVITRMQDNINGQLTVEEAIAELDDWYCDYGRTVKSYDIHDYGYHTIDDDHLERLEYSLDVDIDNELAVTCTATYANGTEKEFYFEFVQVDGQWYLLFVLD